MTIETLRKDVFELRKNVLRKQTTINNYINRLKETKKELACAKCEHDAIKLKLDSYSNSRYVLDHIIDVQKKKGDWKGIGYQACPPPVRHNNTKIPDDEDMPQFEPTIPLDLAEFIAGLGFTKGTSSSQIKSVESLSASCESVNLLYTLIGSDKIYSNKDFPIKNVNQSLIDKVFEDSTSKFLGKSSPRVVVTQCASIPKSEVRKKYRNQKLQPQNNQRKQNHATQGKGKGKHSQNKKNVQKVNFVKSLGIDKIESFENKSNMDFVIKSQILKRNYQNNYTQHTNYCDVGPSTSRSRSSSSSSYNYDTPRFVERRSCFECGEYGHIVKNCPYLTKGKAKIDAPHGNGYHTKPVSPKQDPRLLENALKPEVIQTQCAKPELKNEIHKQVWKPKPVTVLMGVQSFPNHQEIEVTILDDVGRTKSTKAWVPISN
ncbi:putative transcription factor interactor and regulator CCHC(Zn) family [Helianthus anomalus]